MAQTKVKICCISSLQEASLALKYGADVLGLVGEMPSGPGVISDAMINDIARNIPPPLSSFLLTSQTKATGIINHHKKVQTTAIQIVDTINHFEYASLREALPNVKLVQVVHVIDKKSIDKAIQVSEYVDTILLDSGNPNLAVKELGGTGRTHNWLISKEIVKAVSVPVFLAGGLNPSNVKEAIDSVNPYGVDLCSGLRTNGQLDESKVAKFMQAIHETNS